MALLREIYEAAPNKSTRSARSNTWELHSLQGQQVPAIGLPTPT